MRNFVLRNDPSANIPILSGILLATDRTYDGSIGIFVYDGLTPEIDALRKRLLKRDAVKPQAAP